MAKKNVIIITGANVGFGKACALAAKSAYQEQDLSVALLGRNGVELDSVAAEMNPVPTFVFSNFHCDNYDQNGLKIFIRQLEECCDDSTNLTIIHNAATVGDPTKTARDLSAADVTGYMTLNLSSAVALTNDFLSSSIACAKKAVVNVTSLAATQPLASLSLYCTGKAARNMYFKVLAEENQDIRVLNYAPGPLDTPMFHNIRKNSCVDDTRKNFQDIVPLTPLESAEKLMRILKEDNFQSGAHIDFYDYE